MEFYILIIKLSYYVLCTGQIYRPVFKSYRLNERMYGDLEGKSKVSLNSYVIFLSLLSMLIRILNNISMFLMELKSEDISLQFIFFPGSDMH